MLTAIKLLLPPSQYFFSLINISAGFRRSACPRRSRITPRLRRNRRGLISTLWSIIEWVAVK
jgi:hypothetical protein